MSTLSVQTIKNITTSPPTIKNSSDVEVGKFALAWVNFTGTGTVTINSSFNVASITDHGTGDYAVNFSTALADGYYAATPSIVQAQAAERQVASGSAAFAPTASVYRCVTWANSGSLVDMTQVGVSFFR